ncbi:DUF6011 domain-containing protein [Streptomyces sp. XM4193]|uniref:DUF6011 domain-containing protein n=1 Tax=Streptomyces sp. XM4193 TaxID=2929782 RepID=UPI001FF83D48|nr:DUF6011 domain-containing protein [Streptomyces sp. XM4193]MCK1798016.1 DUF6011 domain-containing protein [Streptomyces sp. XM4193]
MSSPDELPVDAPRAARTAPVPCRMCGQPLRDAMSRRWGLGRDCRRKLRMRLAPAPEQHEVEQDALPGL